MGNKAFIAEFNAEEKYKTGEEYSLPSFHFQERWQIVCMMEWMVCYYAC